jgi:hypothetical protein
VLAVLLFIVIGLLLLTGQTVIFLLRLVAADRRAQGRRRPLASATKTVGEMEDEHRVAYAVGAVQPPAGGPTTPASSLAAPSSAGSADAAPPASSPLPAEAGSGAEALDAAENRVDDAESMIPAWTGLDSPDQPTADTIRAARESEAAAGSPVVSMDDAAEPAPGPADTSDEPPDEAAQHETSTVSRRGGADVPTTATDAADPAPTAATDAADPAPTTATDAADPAPTTATDAADREEPDPGVPQ